MSWLKPASTVTLSGLLFHTLSEAFPVEIKKIRTGYNNQNRGRVHCSAGTYYAFEMCLHCSKFEQVSSFINTPSIMSYELIIIA